jgi:hypothetical protein
MSVCFTGIPSQQQEPDLRNIGCKLFDHFDPICERGWLHQVVERTEAQAFSFLVLILRGGKDDDGNIS